jgi:diacylglycerol O-acyltransferase / wax synthase
LTDDVTLVDPHEATDAMIDAFTEIRRAAGLSEQLRTLDAALPLAAAAS